LQQVYISLQVGHGKKIELHFYWTESRKAQLHTHNACFEYIAVCGTQMMTKHLKSVSTKAALRKGIAEHRFQAMNWMAPDIQIIRHLAFHSLAC